VAAMQLSQKTWSAGVVRTQLAQSALPQFWQ
jgi:hypothetical protein